jgi:hypothetical protein
MVGVRKRMFLIKSSMRLIWVQAFFVVEVRHLSLSAWGALKQMMPRF